MARILIIDDDEQILSLLELILTQAGHDVVTASNGKEGARQYRSEPADLIITDIIMPEKEGIETIVELRREYPEINIIAMSGGGRFGPEHFLQLARKLGANMSISKPFKRDEILAAIDSVLKSSI